MKRRPSFTVYLCALAMSAVSLIGPATPLLAQDAFDAADAVIAPAPVEAQNAAPVEAQDAAEASALPAMPNVNPAEYLNPLVQESWVTVDGDDRLRGKYLVLTPNGDARALAGVAINVGRNGVVIQSTVTEPDGSFALSGVSPGCYALVAQSPNSIAAFALHVLPNGASRRLDSDFVVFGTSVGGPVVGDILRAHLVPGDPAPGYYADLPMDPHGDARRFSANASVQLSPQGDLTGRISRANGRASGNLGGNVVHILSGGRVVSHVPTNASGDFRVAGMTPGTYDFVIAGKDGVAAGSFRAVGAGGVVQSGKASTQLVSTVNNQDGQARGLNVELVAPIDWLAGQPEFLLPPDEELLAPVAGGGMVGPGGFGGGFGGGLGGGGGGFGGGGGGIGGGGGLGGLLGLAGLAAGVAAAAANDDGFTIASPQ